MRSTTSGWRKPSALVPAAPASMGNVKGLSRQPTLPQVLSALQASWVCVPEKVQGAYFPLHWDTEPGTALQPARQVPKMGLPARAAAGADRASLRPSASGHLLRKSLQWLAESLLILTHGLTCTTFSFFCFFFGQIISTQLIITLNVPSSPSASLSTQVHQGEAIKRDSVLLFKLLMWREAGYYYSYTLHTYLFHYKMQFMLHKCISSIAFI